MNKLLCGMLGALALCAVSSSGRAAPLAPVGTTVFHPVEQAGLVQTVQYDRHYRPHGFRPPFRGRYAYRHGFFHGGPRPFYHRGHGYERRPFRRY